MAKALPKAPRMLPQTPTAEADTPAFDARDSNESRSRTIGSRKRPATAFMKPPRPLRAPASAEWPTRRCGAVIGDDYDPFATLTRSKSLADHLNEQAQLAFSEAHDRLIARYLIDLVDGDGYIRTPLEEVCGQLSLQRPWRTSSACSSRSRPSIRPAFAREIWRSAWRYS